jgi:hypothetical protein
MRQYYQVMAVSARGLFPRYGVDKRAPEKNLLRGKKKERRNRKQYH